MSSSATSYFPISRNFWNLNSSLKTSYRSTGQLKDLSFFFSLPVQLTTVTEKWHRFTLYSWHSDTLLVTWRQQLQIPVFTSIDSKISDDLHILGQGEAFDHESCVQGFENLVNGETVDMSEISLLCRSFCRHMPYSWITKQNILVNI